MARHSVGALSAGIGSNVLPLLSLYGVATSGGALRECGITNTTATSASFVLRRATTAGTQGATLTETQHDLERAVPLCQGFNTHTVGPTLTAGDLGYRVVLGAAVGSGVIWTFGDTGIRIQPGTGNGVGILVENGAGQIIQGYFTWDE